MAVQLDMSTTPFRRGRNRLWQPALAALLLLIAGGETAKADTATGLIYMKQGLYIRALIEFEAPAKAGDPVAEANIGAIYHYGMGVSANFAKAVPYYHAAALQGNIDAQLGLAVLYTTGKGVPPSFPIARMWLSIAAEAMPPSPDRIRVTETRDAIALKMSAEELKESDDLIAAWYARHTAP
jgi:TPR repeat protein